MLKMHFVLTSGNNKTGSIPVTTTEEKSCPSACPLKGQGCYAELGNQGRVWRNVTSGKWGKGFADVLHSIATLPIRTLWRHNVAGDLPHTSERIEADSLALIIKANAGKRGFTYTHHDVSESDNGRYNRQQIYLANRKGFAINLSANNLEHADYLKSLGIGPVVTMLPEDSLKVSHTPNGHKVLVCPAVTTNGITCAKCGICARIERDTIIGFPVHGNAKKKAQKVFSMKHIG